MNSNPLFQSVREWVELFNLLSGVIVCVAAIYGLQQIRIMKKDMQTRNERAAKEKAIEYASRYLSQYIALANVMFHERTQKGIPGYDGPTGDFTRNSIEPKYLPDTAKRLNMDSVLPALNELQSISCAFVTGVADEKLGFSIIGRTYCSTVASKYDVLSWLRSSNVYPHYQSIVDLYKIWSPRLTKAELESARENMDKQILAIPDKEIPPIGSS
ncbi:MAG: hypothetical protein IPP66_17715 [Anaerolineales bacterium]|nr:hypothetical protein [Anaerolineales bacterium]